MVFRIARVVMLFASVGMSSCGTSEGESQPTPTPPVQPPPPGVPTVRASVASAGTQATGTSLGPSLSADGRYLAFHSDSADLVPGDVNGYQDVFVRDTVLNTTTLVSVNPAGEQGNQGSFGASISADGRYIAFLSEATNLVPGDTNLYCDAFVRDMTLNTVTRLSVDSAGAETNHTSDSVSISADGRYVVFSSRGTNLVPGDTNLTWDVFVRDTHLNTTTRVSVNSAGEEGDELSSGGSISADGRYIAFHSWAGNLVADDTNVADIFLRDTVLNTTTLISAGVAGSLSDHHSWGGSISADGRYVAFSTLASNLVPGVANSAGGILVRDTVLNTTTLVSVDSSGMPGTNESRSHCISADGRYVAFCSFAENLVAGDTNGAIDAFVRDTVLNTTTRVSVDSSGAQGDGHSAWGISISADGRYVAFESAATNLVPGDSNGLPDVFLH